MLVRNVSHEARNGGKASVRTLAAPVVAVTERREKAGTGAAVSGRTEQELPRAIEQLQCVHAQKGQNARGEQPARNRRGSRRRWVPTICGPTRLSKRGRQNRCIDVLQRGSRRRR